MASATQSFRLSNSLKRVQRPLLILAATFLGGYAAALSLSPAARLRSWDVDYRWQHWVGYLVWLVLIIIADWQTRRVLPGRDPYLLPAAALLCGWGLMTIWRLYPDFGLRQTIWIAVAITVFCLGIRLPVDLSFLRRYKYVLLTGGLILTAFTLIFGTNPAASSGPRLWLGCCGFYFQPSEPLKLLLIIFLSAYLAGKKPWISLSPVNPQGKVAAVDNGGSKLSLFAPLILMTGLTLLLLVVQRDLGTATIFLFLFAVITFLATEKKIILLISGVLLSLAGMVSYFMFDVVRLRIDAWLNPWLDPSNRSYQIVQSLIALANGGVGGRGPGLGSPSLVPISHSDFIFSAIVEESGLLGAIGLIGLLILLTGSGIRISLRAPDNFRRYLAAGLTAYLVGQSLLIIGGNIRLLPLTGVTLPFVSYGGSSLLTAFVSLTLLALISQSGSSNPRTATNPRVYIRLGQFLLISLAVTAVAVGWWTYQRGPDLLERTDNARRAISERYVKRGDIYDRKNQPIASTSGRIGEYTREYQFPALGSLIGYSHPVYGQSGLEASLDPYLRGLEGQSAWYIWWHHLLYGEPPPGVDVRLHLDMDLQQKANQLMAGYSGATVLQNADTGELLAMVSLPTYEPSEIEENWSQLLEDERTPLLNRVTQGRYAPGTALGAFLLAAATAGADFGDLELETLSIPSGNDCAVPGEITSWASAIGAGCAGAQVELSRSLGDGELKDFLDELGLTSESSLDIQEQESTPREPAFQTVEEVILSETGFTVSPLQMVRAAGTLSSGGWLPQPQLAGAIRPPGSEWKVFPGEENPKQILPKNNSDQAANFLAETTLPIWQAVGQSETGSGEVVTWYLAGTLPSWGGSRLALVTILEADAPQDAMRIGQQMMKSALHIE